MTNADVANVVATAAGRGIRISDYEALVFLGAKEILARDADNKDALEVVEGFTRYMATGIEPSGFAEFFLPLPETDETIAERAKGRA
jgi:hypothetical protein